MATQLNDCAAVRCHLHTLSCNQWKHCYSWPIFGISFLYTLLGCTHNIFVTVRLLIFKYLLKTSDQNGKRFWCQLGSSEAIDISTGSFDQICHNFCLFSFLPFPPQCWKTKIEKQSFQEASNSLHHLLLWHSLSLRYIIALTDTYLLTDWVTWIHYNSHVRTIESLEINVFRQASCCQLVTRRVRAKMI